MLDALARDLRAGERPALIRAARRAYLLALGTLAVPGALLGGLYALSRPAPTPWPAVWGLLVLSVLLALGALHLAHRAARSGQGPASQAALTGAIQAASVPGVPLLLGCTALTQPAALLAFWAVAAALHVLVWRALPGWVRAPEGTPQQGVDVARPLPPAEAGQGPVG